jgi:hypothetical protein
MVAAAGRAETRATNLRSTGAPSRHAASFASTAILARTQTVAALATWRWLRAARLSIRRLLA